MKKHLSYAIVLASVFSLVSVQNTTLAATARGTSTMSRTPLPIEKARTPVTTIKTSPGLKTTAPTRNYESYKNVGRGGYSGGGRTTGGFGGGR